MNLLILGIIILLLSAALAYVVISFQRRILNLTGELSAKTQEAASLTREAEAREKETEALEQELKQAREKILAISADNSAMKNSLAAKEQMKLEFKELAQQIIDEKSKSIDQRTNDILKPLNDEMKRLETAVQDTYGKSIKDQTDLRAELKKIADLNTTLQAEANNLATALKGDNKVQGCWGEMVLEKVLEMSGLEKGIGYRTQESFPLDGNRRLQPDAVIYLTDGRTIIVDSKVSLTAYERYVSAADEKEREKSLDEHVISLKAHVKELADKDYAHRLGLDTPEYVMMFVPVESSFGVAANREKGLYDYAWSQRVVIVTPSTLLASLAAVSQMWRQDKQTRNAIEIARRAGALYDKTAGLVEELGKVNKSLDDAKRHLGSASNRLNEGNGNVLSQMEKLKELGAKATKSLSDSSQNLNKE